MPRVVLSKERRKRNIIEPFLQSRGREKKRNIIELFLQSCRREKTYWAQWEEYEFDHDLGHLNRVPQSRFRPFESSVPSNFLTTPALRGYTPSFKTEGSMLLLFAGPQLLSLMFRRSQILLVISQGHQFKYS